MSNLKLINIQNEYIGHRTFVEDEINEYFLIKTDLTDTEIQDVINGIVDRLNEAMEGEVDVCEIMNSLAEKDDVEAVQMISTTTVIVNI